jgi:hypothetical protein
MALISCSVGGVSRYLIMVISVSFSASSAKQFLDFPQRGLWYI